MLIGEWNIPIDATIQKLKSFSEGSSQFRALLTLDDVPVTTGGIYNHVGLLNKEPRFSVYKYWLALVYTVPFERQQGYGTLICDFIQEHSQKTGIKEIVLFTDTAERLYTRLGWNALDRLPVGVRKIVVMKKQLYGKYPNYDILNRLIIVRCRLAKLLSIRKF